MKLKFVIDKTYDKSFVNDKKILGYINQEYKTSLKFLKLTQKLYQKSWNEINDEFSEYAEKITGYKWFYPEYKCVISIIHVGISNWGEKPVIMRHWKENPYYMRRITAHELILSHYFEIIKRKYKRENLKDGQIWALAEIAAFSITHTDEAIRKFWPWSINHDITRHNYLHIVVIQKKLNKIFKENDFDDYIKKGIQIIKDYPNINPKGNK